MRKKVNKKILFGVFGSLLIGVSSIVTPVMVVSNTQKGVLNYSKKFNFSNEKDIKNSFNTANISIETTNNYINSVKNLKQSKIYSNSTSLLENIIEVQNEISLRRVNNNSSLEELNFDINNVKNVLKKDSNAYLNYQKIDESNYEYLKALYVKSNVESWSSLNNVKKYDLIYGYLNIVYESIKNFYELYYLKQLINKKEIETREKQILENNLKVNKLRQEIKLSDKSIIKSIKEVDEFFNKKIKSDFYEKIVKRWETIKNLYISVITFTSAAIVALAMTFIPIIGQFAFTAGNIAAIAASGMNIVFKFETNMLYSEIDENSLSIIDSLIFLANAYLFYSKFKPLAENRIIVKSALFLKKVLGLSISLIKAVALITIITSVAQLVLVNLSFAKIKEAKDSYIKNTSKEINDSIDFAIKEERNKIKEKNNYIYKKTIEIDNIRKNNSILEKEVLNIKMLNSNMNSDFQLFYNLVKDIPSLNSKKINLIKQRTFKKINNMKNLSLSKLFNELKIKTFENENIKNKRKVCLEIFNSKYNYSDKKYWKSVSNNIIESSFLNLHNVLLK